jgi:cell division septal protein FtsQ
MTATRTVRRIKSSQQVGSPRIHPAIPSTAALILVLAALTAIVQGAYRVRRLDIVGTNVPATAIAKAAGVLGHNIFRLRSDAIVRRLDALPSVEVSRITTTFPDTVTIFAIVRTPYAAWQVGGVVNLLDDTGRIIGQTKSTSLPVILGLPGMHPPGFAVLQAARYALQSLPTAPDGTVLHVQMDPKLGLVIVGQSGWQAVVGSGTPQLLAQRVATLSALLVAIAHRSQSLQYADLRYREPYYRQR